LDTKNFDYITKIYSINRNLENELINGKIIALVNTDKKELILKE
jgi:hypothetical protein